MVWRRCHFSLLFMEDMDRQMELHRLHTSTGTFPAHLQSLLLLLWHVTPLIDLHSPFFPLACLISASMLCSPAEPLLPCSLLCVAEGRTSREDWLLRKMGEIIRSCKLPLFTLRSALGQIKTGSPGILFPGETPHARWRCCFVKLCNILNDANRHPFWGVGTRLSIYHWDGGNHQEWPPLKKHHQNEAPRVVAHLAQKCREHTGGYKEKINKIFKLESSFSC